MIMEKYIYNGLIMASTVNWKHSGFGEVKLLCFVQPPGGAKEIRVQQILEIAYVGKK